MDKKQKRIIQALRGAGWTYTKVAKSLNLSTSTVKSLCFRNGYGVRETHDADGRTLCRQCGKSLQQISRGRSKLFCSDKCRYNWWNVQRALLGGGNTVTLTCLNCGDDFTTYGQKDRKYCCTVCYASDRKREGGAP